MPFGPTLGPREERQLALDVHRLVVRYPVADLLVYLRAAVEARHGMPSPEYQAIDEAYAYYCRMIDEARS